MNIQTNYDYIPNLKHPYLISANSHLLNFGSLEHTLIIPVKEYSIKQIIEAVCQNVKSVDMIFYSAIKEELIFYSSVPMNGIEEDVDHFLEKHLWKKREQYKKEAEKFVGKMEERCKLKSDISPQEISLKSFFNLVIEKYQKEIEYIHELEKRWKRIMIENSIITERDSSYRCRDNIGFGSFEDGILSFHVTVDYTYRFHFFIPSDFEKTTVRKTDLWASEKENEFLEIQEEGTALRIASLLMNDLLTLYKRCEAKSSLYSMMKTHNFPAPIFYEDYEIRIIIQEEGLKIQSASLEILTKEIEIVRIDFPLANKTEPKKSLLAKLLLQKDSIYDNYTIITSNIRQSGYLRENLLNVLNRINIDRKFCDKI